MLAENSWAPMARLVASAKAVADARVAKPTRPAAYLRMRNLREESAEDTRDGPWRTAVVFASVGVGPRAPGGVPAGQGARRAARRGRASAAVQRGHRVGNRGALVDRHRAGARVWRCGEGVGLL